MCKVTGCSGEIDRKGYCSKHYMRQWRNGTTDKIQSRKPRTIHSGGYILIDKPDHPLADSTGYVYEHRYVFYGVYGGGPFHCFWCGAPINWKNMHIDHYDNDVKNNSIENLNPSCPQCNQSRGREKLKETWRKKAGFSYKGELRTAKELADIIGISKQSFRNRLKTMSLNEAMSKPKGNTGPKKHGEIKL
jgi:pyruvate-formate lyase-activating enzyme